MTTSDENKPYFSKHLQRWLCRADVPNGGNSVGFHACGATAKYDPVDGKPTRCGIHRAEAVARRRAASKAKHDAKRAAYHARAAAQDAAREKRDAAYAALRQIAEGHNDPRSLAADWVATHDKEENR